MNFYCYYYYYYYYYYTAVELPLGDSSPYTLVHTKQTTITIHTRKNTKKKQSTDNIKHVNKIHIQGGARNVIPLIVHVTHFYY